MIAYYYICNGSILDCFLIGVVYRYTVSLHRTWTINSFAHIFGDQHYSKSVGGRDVFRLQHLFMYGIGEGWHNYHHSFPWDYKMSEFGWRWNVCGFFIDCMAAIGQAYDLKTASPELVKRHKLRVAKGELHDEDKSY